MIKKFIITLFIILVGIYTFLIFRPPTPLPSHEKLIETMNSVPIHSKVIEILDIIPLDDQHVFVPFRSDKGSYGKSFWNWTMKGWKMDCIDTEGNPYIWKLKEKDASNHYFVWNLSPQDKIEKLKLVLKRDRGYQVSENAQNYDPAILMEHTISLKSKGYGISPMPKEFADVLNGDIYLQNKTDSDPLFGFMQPSNIIIGMIPYDKSGNQKFPQNSVNGERHSNGDELIDYVLFIDESETK
ncbi:hypothetical protein [Peribacillus tepidiphilus]|uniref:hypothetical protein n=1 Tax=Peribacillus tepidiphilus TaxID=2652445 RepID=UPI001291ED41|nr:hypothetical protein [Peribacillus tepidiphilus]